jgi:hypothetical protein
VHHRAVINRRRHAGPTPLEVSQTAEVAVTEAPGPKVDHFAFRLQPHDVHTNERFLIEVALSDAGQRRSAEWNSDVRRTLRRRG